MATAHTPYGLLAVKLRKTVDARRCCRQLLVAGRILHIAAKDIIRRYVNQRSIDSLCRESEIFDSCGVDELGNLPFLLCPIYIGIGCAVDDVVDIMLFDE